jgi:transcriptional regulator with XRE-family HTH domain
MDLIERHIQQEQDRKNARKNMADLETIGNRLTLARKISGTSQLDAAAALGLKTAGLISKYETDRRRPAFESIKVLAELYECQLQELIPAGDPYERFLTMNESGPANESGLAFRPGIVTVKTKDDSMAPIFLKGDLVLADATATQNGSWGYAVIKCGDGNRVCLLTQNSKSFVAEFLHPGQTRHAFPVDPKNIIGPVIELRRSFTLPTPSRDNEEIE